MIPLVLNDGRISFLGFQVKFLKKDYENEKIKKAVGKMAFSNMFGGESNDRPFGLIILSLGHDASSLKVFNLKQEEPESSATESYDPLDSPSVFVVQGIPASAKDPEFFLSESPSDDSCYGIDAKYYEDYGCLKELIQEQEIPPAEETEREMFSSLISHSSPKRLKRSIPSRSLLDRI